MMVFSSEDMRIEGTGAEDVRMEGAHFKGAHINDAHAEDTSTQEIFRETCASDTRVGNAHIIKNRQSYLLWGIGSLLVGGTIVYGWVAMRETPFNRKQEFKSSLLTGSSRINPQEAWVYKFGTEAEITKKRLDALEEMLSKVLKMGEAFQKEALKGSSPRSSQVTSLVPPQRDASQGDASQRDGSQNDISPMARIEDLREDLHSAKDDIEGEHPKPTGEALSHSGILLPPPPGPSSPHLVPTQASGGSPLAGTQGNPPSSQPFRSRAVRKITLSLRNARSNMSLKTVDNTVPAGAFAKAVLLGGVDASASIQASSDPRPALLRLIDAGTLPRKFRSDLKGCHALAACYGDISSERVFMRLEKLTCTERKTGEIVEVKVQGYIAGEDGRTGVRGSVVDRAGESMRNVLMGGFLGGIGEFLGQSRSAVTFSPTAGLAQAGSLTQANPMGMGDMLKAGAGKGINNALEKYADFYIKRAEQLQPVIQVAAGRQVDIVFTEGVSIGDSLYRQAIGRSNDQGSYHQIQSMNEGTQEPQPTLSDWVGSRNPTQ